MGDTVTRAPVAVTERAAEKAIELSAREGHTRPILRVRVTAGGCSGFQYVLGFEDATVGDDLAHDFHGLTLVVDPKSAPIVEGSTLEFVDAMLGGGFKMQNPRAVHECACGDSFSV